MDSQDTVERMEPEVRSSSPQLDLRVEKSFHAIQSLRGEWDRVAAEHGGSVYSCFDWCKTWWEFYAFGRELRICLFFEDDTLVSVLPLYLDRIGIWPLRITVARLVCASIPPKAFNPPVDPEKSSEIFKLALKYLVEKDRCDVLSYGPVSETHQALAGLRTAATGLRGLVRSHDSSGLGVHSMFAVPGSLDEFMEGLDKDERKKRKYEGRLLRRDHPITEQVLTAPAEVEAEFDKFAVFHAEQWSEKNRAGHFGSWPRGLEFNRTLVKALAESDRVRFVRLIAGDKVISSQYVFSFAETYFWELPARAMEREWHKYSLGLAGFFSVVDAAAREGKKMIEAGVAHYDYKKKLNALEIPTHTIRIVRDRAGSRLAVKIFDLIRSAALVLYHKIWYQRIVPRLPGFVPRCQAVFWLRLDF